MIKTVTKYPLHLVYVLMILLVSLTAFSLHYPSTPALAMPQATPTPVVFPNANVEFVIGPQVKTGSSFFDTNELSRATVHGDAFPATPPTPLSDPYILAHYYDLGHTGYIAYYRSADAAYLTQARKVADSWWQSSWINSGAVRNFDAAGPPPRHAGIASLVLRAMDGRPEMWDWVNAYTRYHFNLWLKTRIGNNQLYYGLREGAFALHYAVWLAKVLPDSFPLQAGGTGNGVTLRAQYLADVEAQTLNYFARLQYPDGSWRWDDPDFVDSDGGKLVGIMQPFMVGLLLNALIDVHRLSTNAAVKASIQTQLTKACAHLYAGGPYRRTEETGISGKKWRSFWYFYHGGTTVNATKYATGGGSYVSPAESWQVKSERQSISTLFSAYGYAYLLTSDGQYLTMGEELVDAAFVNTDGIRNEADGTAKNYNQNYRMGGRYFAWKAGNVAPTPTPTPTISISGRVLLEGDPLPSVVVQLLRSSDRVKLSEVTTSGNGAYSLAPTSGSSVIVFPVRTGYTFSPSEVLFSTIIANQTQDLTATAPLPTPNPTVSPSPSPATDTVKPIASITSPANGVTVSTTISVNATATDNVGVNTVYLVVDDLVVGADSAAPYGFSLSIAGMSSGSHSMYVRAWDAAGNAGDSSRVAFTISSGTPTPTPTPTPTSTPSPTPTPTPTPTPSPTPTPTPGLPTCRPNQLVGTPPVCTCTTKIVGPAGARRCRP